MPTTVTLYKVFFGSPLGLQYRSVFASRCCTFNESMGASQGVVFLPVFSDQSPGGIETGGQKWADSALMECDFSVFLYAINKDAESANEPDETFSSGTISEMELALEANQDSSRLMQDVLIVFEKDSIDSHADPGGRRLILKKTRVRLKDKEVYFRETVDINGFQEELTRQLKAWLDVHRNPSVTAPKQSSAVQMGYRNKHIERIEFPGEQMLDEEGEVYKKLYQAGMLADECKVEKAEDIYKYLEEKYRDYPVLNDYAKFLFRKGDIEKSRTLFERIESRAEIDDDHGWIARAKANLAILALSQYEIELAIHLLKQSEAKNEKLNHGIGMADNYRWLSVAYRQNGKINDAEKWALKSIAKFEVHNKQENCEAFLADAYSELGIIFRIQGNYKDSQSYYEKAIDVNARLETPKESCRADYLDHLGTVYRVTGHLERAKKQYKQALDINHSLKRRRGISDNWGHLAHVNCYMGFVDNATTQIGYAKKEAKDIGYQEGLAKHYAVEARIHLMKKNPSSAHDAANTSLRINETIDSKEGIASAKLLIAQILMLERQYSKALENLMHAAKEFALLGAREGVAECLELESRLAPDIGGEIESIRVECEKELAFCKLSGARLMQSSLLIALARLNGKMHPCNSLLEQARVICKETKFDLNMQAVNLLLSEETEDC